MHNLENAEVTRQRRDRLEAGVRKLIPQAQLNGHPRRCLPHILNLTLPGLRGESLVIALDQHGISLSSGSACTSASREPSYVLRALGRSDELAHSSIRFTIGRFTTRDEVDYTIELVKGKIDKLRALSPLWEMYQDGIDLDSVQWAAH